MGQKKLEKVKGFMLSADDKKGLFRCCDQLIDSSTFRYVMYQGLTTQYQLLFLRSNVMESLLKLLAVNVILLQQGEE